MRFDTGNYEPSNDLFKFLMLTVLLAITGFFYIIFKASYGGFMQWYDWFVLAGIGFAAGYFLFQTYRYRF